MKGSPGLVRYFVVPATMALGYGSIYTLLAEIRNRFDFTGGQVGLIAGIGFFGGFVAQVFLARFADRGHAATMVRCGILAAVAGMAWTIVAVELWQWVGARLLLGIGSGVVGPAIRRVVIARDPERVGVNLGRQAAFDVAGFVMGPLVAAGLAEVFGLRAPFVGLTALYIVMLGWAWGLDLSSGAVARERRVVRGLVRIPAMQAALAASVAFYVTIGIFEAVWAMLLDDLGARTWLIGLTLSLFTVPMVVLAPLGGAMAQRRGPMRVVAYSIAVATLCTAGYGAFGLWVVVAISAVHAVADAFTLPGNQVAVAIASPRQHLAAGQGLLGATGLAVAGLMGVAGGAVYEHAGRGVLFGGTAAVMALFLAIARWRGRELVGPVVPTPEHRTATPSP